jgi:hypothetical protein
MLICWDIIKTKRDFQLVSSQKVLELTILSYPMNSNLQKKLPFPSIFGTHRWTCHGRVTPWLWVWSNLSRVVKDAQICVWDVVITHGTKWLWKKTQNLKTQIFICWDMRYVPYKKVPFPAIFGKHRWPMHIVMGSSGIWSNPLGLFECDPSYQELENMYKFVCVIFSSRMAVNYIEKLRKSQKYKKIIFWDIKTKRFSISFYSESLRIVHLIHLTWQKNSPSPLSLAHTDDIHIVMGSKPLGFECDPWYQ